MRGIKGIITFNYPSNIITFAPMFNLSIIANNYLKFCLLFTDAPNDIIYIVCGVVIAMILVGVIIALVAITIR